MRLRKKTKLYKTSLFLLGLMFLVNFSFCWMPLAVSAQTLNKSEEIIPEISPENINFNEENSCEETSYDYENDKTGSQETATSPEDNTSKENAVLPCCLDHEKVTKIDNTPKLEVSNPIFYAISENNISNTETLIKNSSCIQSLDLPPPKADILSSVCKKE